MHNTKFTSAIADAENALTIDAFDRFRDAAHKANLALPAINALAEYKAAVGFTLQALEATSRGDNAEAEKQAYWSRAMLAGMDAELAKLMAGMAE